MNFIVLSSSRGTTFQSVINALHDGSLTAHCLGLVTDLDDRACIQKARDAGLPFRAVGEPKEMDREEFDKGVDAAIHELVDEAGVEKHDTVIAEMGWMWIHTPWFIGQWKNRILNVHPALLPDYGGKGMYGNHVHKAVLKAGESESGMTIHIMDEGVDTGEILVQKNCSIDEGETVDSLKAKVQELEKEWYPKALQMIEEGTLKLPT